MEQSPVTLTQRGLHEGDRAVRFSLPLTAWERGRSRYQTQTQDGQNIHLRLPRGTVLQPGEVLYSEAGDIAVKIVAQPERVLEVTAESDLALLRAAYHLGNRHVAVELTSDYLRLEVDPVLQKMLEQLGLHVVEKVAPFQPETGAYHHGDR
ncbi:urease accessory protein UreE [Roseofilum casamattae]|uniref:Urease accessory protein UreE n=1 Tax=Roseofilum casamattae BLCC-M143 TaxID=3022442 RepID=A0ABT7BY69_9CYAN|nr:urease accessory protein UreE [Roseofilum casamattae]MDJ1184010.1 urease accessory protein UreE [Roseofilum casamattae BLCC-M143]